MGISVETLAVAKKYTNRSIEGITGSLAGKNATIDSITDITGGHRVTFKWTADNGDVRTQSMDVMDGSKGDKGETGDAGLGIKAVNINAQNHLIITYDNDSTYDAGELPGGSGEVISVNGKKGVVTLDANDVGALPDDTELFSGDYNDLDNLPDLTNFITNTVDNLINYYKKTETYTKTEVDNIANTIKNGRFEVVATLPTTDIKTNVIYFVPKPDTQSQNIKDEYINLDGTTAGWEKIGDTEIDLSGYVTTTALNTALAAYTTTTDLTALLADKVDKVTGKGLSTNDYTNTDKELVDSIPTLAPISLVKDAVGWTGKNLLKNIASTQTVNGVTFTVNADKSVTVNGTGTNPNAGVRELNQHFTLPAGNYILSGSPHNVYSDTGFRLQIYNWTDSKEVVFCVTDEDVPFSIGENKDIAVRIWFRGTPSTSGEDVTFYPMIRRADIIDDTYEPYHESVEVMYEEEIHGVNLLKNTATSQTINGVTFTVNADGSVTANGTASSTQNAILHILPFNGEPAMKCLENGKTYILSGLNSGNSAIFLGVQYWKDGTWLRNVTCYDGNDVVFTVPPASEVNRIGVVYQIVRNNTAENLICKPMLRKADIEDSTYRPYNKQAIQNQINAQGVLGAKNLLQVNTTSRAVNGITFTLNDDNSFTANGTATADTYFESHIMSAKANDVYIVSDNLANPSDSTYRGKVMGKTTGIDYAFLTTGKEIKFTVTNTEKIVYSFKVKSGQTINNITFKPMLRLASDPDDTYQPYAMTNLQLTNEVLRVKEIPVEWNENLNLGSDKGGSILQYGKLYFVTYWFKATTATTNNVGIVKLPKNGLIGGNYVITEGNDTAVWGGRATIDGVDYASISCPMVVDKVYRAQCIWVDKS